MYVSHILILLPVERRLAYLHSPRSPICLGTSYKFAHIKAHTAVPEGIKFEICLSIQDTIGMLIKYITIECTSVFTHLQL